MQLQDVVRSTWRYAQRNVHSNFERSVRRSVGAAAPAVRPDVDRGRTRPPSAHAVAAPKSEVNALAHVHAEALPFLHSVHQGSWKFEADDGWTPMHPSVGDEVERRHADNPRAVFQLKAVRELSS